MANLYLYFDKRTPRKDGTCSLKVALAHKHKTVYHPIDIFVKPDEWDEKNNQVVQRPDKKFMNVLIKKKLAEMTVTLQRILIRDDADELTCREMMDMLVRGTDTVDRPQDCDYVVPVYNEYIALCAKTSTAATYKSSLRNLIEYEKDIDSLRFKDINVTWLKKYQQWLLKERGMDVNGANVYLRNLRAIFNHAIKNQFTKARYPFPDIDMSTVDPDKREIPYETFLEWVSKPMSDNRNFYRDLFMLSFYLCGIRPIDLLSVKKEQVQDGRLVYWPEKLNGRTKLSIKIEPEAWEIIHKYEGKEHLLRILDDRGDYRAFMQHWNKALKAIGTDVYTPTICGNGKTYQLVKHVGIVPFITVYYARRCWGTYAYNILDIPIDTISQAMGHKNGLRVTNFYVKRSNEKVDLANRAMIDKLKADLEEYKRENNIA